MVSAAASDRPLLVANPRSGGTRMSEARWARYVGPITAGLGELDVRFTEHSGHARQIAREEAEAGRRLLVAVGGDGTINEVADGILTAAATTTGPAATALGIIPRGTGGDFRRTLDLPEDPGAAARRIKDSAERVIDAARATYTTEEGTQESRHYVNVASFGFSAAVARRANAASKALGGRVAYLSATVRTLLGQDNDEVWIRADDGEPVRRRVAMGAAGNGRCFGGGMKICPGALLDDGLLQLVLVGDLGRFEILKNVGRLYDGTHIALDDVWCDGVRRVEIRPVDDAARIPIELDGETPGFLPATFEILPAALKVRF